MDKKTKTIILVTVIATIIVATFAFIKPGGLQGKISLNDNISRAEFSKILAKSLASAKGEYMNSIVSDADCNMFMDVKITDWYGPSICYLYLNDIIKGYADGTFGPSKNMSRAEGVKFIMLTYQKVKYPDNDNINAYTKPEKAYKDVLEGDWYYTWIQGAASLGITDVKPFKNLKFYPGRLLTKGRAQNMINNLNKLLNLSI